MYINVLPNEIIAPQWDSNCEPCVPQSTRPPDSLSYRLNLAFKTVESSTLKLLSLFGPLKWRDSITTFLFFRTGLYYSLIIIIRTYMTCSAEYLTSSTILYCIKLSLQTGRLLVSQPRWYQMSCPHQMSSLDSLCPHLCTMECHKYALMLSFETVSSSSWHIMVVSTRPIGREKKRSLDNILHARTSRLLMHGSCSRIMICIFWHHH